MENPSVWTAFVNGENEDLPFDELFNHPDVLHLLLLQVLLMLDPKGKHKKGKK